MATSLTVNPDAHVESTSVDGYTEEVGVEDTIATLRAGATATASDLDTFLQANLAAGSVSDGYNQMSALYLLFDFSALPATAVITQVQLRIYCQSVQSGWDAALGLYEAVPATDTAIVAADHDYTLWVNTALMTALAPTGWTTSAYNSRTLNAAGLAYIQARQAVDEIARLGMAFTSYMTGSTHGTWGSGLTDEVIFDSADGTNPPELIITYVLSAVLDEAVNVGETNVAQLGLDAIIDQAVNVGEAAAQGFAAVIDQAVNIGQSMNPGIGSIIDEAVNIGETVVSPLAAVIARIISSAIRGTRYIQSHIYKD